ncbi:DUF296 domain-containing protein [bacterium]|nr:MAG: DUF296 domain-containing protein [bacterium]
MEYRQINDAFLVRFYRGEKLPDALITLAEEKGWKSGAFTAIGAVENLTLGYFDLDQKKYVKFPVAGVSEVLALNGNLSIFNNKPFWHLHAIVGDKNGSVRGGHLVCLEVAVTLECWIWPHVNPVERVPDELTGLNFLNLK